MLGSLVAHLDGLGVLDHIESYLLIISLVEELQVQRAGLSDRDLEGPIRCYISVGKSEHMSEISLVELPLALHAHFPILSSTTASSPS